ncbi:hypothetical protein DJ021_07115 [Phenylobacterium hankyongense]|uniref:Uncharacterized protein n=1 Tax=Phenylobacterium hankyongense TaxID=1813876 RepID=A0A328B0Y9_9CAUL|nr:hypothetical protein [Phenylobacterium hankyongense]RAK59586.1 hypothetical protein DJ021_07115 [Phenylobacterium hankyongense]
MNHPEQDNPRAAAERPVIAHRSVSQRAIAAAEMAILLLLAALPPVALWSPLLLGGGVPGAA